MSALQKESGNVTQQHEPQPTASKPEARVLGLMSWKAERDMRKKMDLLKKKNPFVTGIVHHRLYSPVSQTNNVTYKSTQHHKGKKSLAPAIAPQRITRATEKRLLSKACAQGTLVGHVDLQSMSPLRLSKIVSTSRTRGAIRKGENIGLCSGQFNPRNHNASVVNKETDIDNKEENAESVKLKLSSDEDEHPDSFRNSTQKGSTIARSDCKTEAENEVIDNNSPVEEALPSPSNNKTATPSPTEPTKPAFFSPYIVTSRGKSNTRKEQQLRRGFSIGPLPGSENPTKDTVMKNLNISVEDEERTAQYFQFLLIRERNRLSELCEEWAEIKDEPTITEDAQYLIHQAIGQTNLLICEKFERFLELVTYCETGKGEMLVTSKDLQRFWDMMYTEIKDCDTRFEKLENLRTQGWKEVEPPVSKPTGKKKATTRKINITFDKIETSPSAKYRTRFTSGSVDLDNKRFTASNNGRLKLNLLLEVELSHRERISLTVIKVSKMCKTLDLQLDNSDQTPMESILKPSKTLTKGNHVSLNEVPVDEEVGIKLDLAVAITDSLDFNSIDQEVPINSAKQLNFDDSSSEKAVDDHDAKEHSGLRNSVSEYSTSRSTSHRNRLRRERGHIANKQVLPMTPYVRASSNRSESTEMNRRSKISEDLISWETPENLPAWARRSQNKTASSSLI